MRLFDLSGRIAIVTGGNGGIGLGMAEGLASAGATVVLAARNAGKGGTAVQQIVQAGGKAEFAEVDVASETSCRALIHEAAARHGRLDILVNNAGTTIRKPPDALSTAEWHTVIDTNLTSAFICTHAAYPHMKQAGRGKVINIGSMMSIFGTGYAPAYAASKGGIAAHACLRDSLGEGQHPGQCGAAGLDRYRLDPRRAARGGGPERARAWAHARRALGRA